eukprot:TRINITY_DN345_c1_g1_i2.p2 TRINITY_DN345_c1_g1~~TRINITY_DN345_c1_g1_i2.p2  ORF type:complete len:278 (-),score=23.05 TRINITY_DN345_c1_g1_i2:2484-3317(-)
MIYYCVKTSEYLADILDKVSRETQYYVQLDVPLDRAEGIIEKFQKRYDLDQTARQRNYRLKQKPVVDLVVLLNQSLLKIEKVRLCLLCTLPEELREKKQDCSELLRIAYGLDKSELEPFESVQDRQNRLIYRTAIQVGENKQSAPVYELVNLPFTVEQRKQKEIDKMTGWTWRIHKKFFELKSEQLVATFKKAQQIKNTEKQDSMIINELSMVSKLAGFRGVREDVFKFNKQVFPLYFKYLNRKSKVELTVPSYERKSKRLVNSFHEMTAFFEDLQK